MSGLAAKHGAINLSQGFPDFDPPRRLLERVNHHMATGRNQYAPMAGVAPLRAAIAAHRDNNARPRTHAATRNGNTKPKPTVGPNTRLAATAN